METLKMFKPPRHKDFSWYTASNDNVKSTPIACAAQVFDFVRKINRPSTFFI